MGESSADIEYDSVAPTGRRRQRLPVVLLVVTVALLLGGIGGWVLRSWVDARSPEAVVIGQVSEFPPGSVTEVVLDVGHFDPFGLENLDELPSGREFSETRLFVVSDSEGRLMALSQRSPWMGCRVVVVTAAKAIESGYVLPAGVDRSFLDGCHGSLFSLDGLHLAGPGHRGLNRFPVGYLPDGSVVVDLTGVELSTPSR